MDSQPTGVLLVGSVRLPSEPEDPLEHPPSATEIFQTMAEALPNRLRRIPDGETGARHYFINWQDRVFLQSPWILTERALAASQVAVLPRDRNRQDVELAPTEYDTEAIKSYEQFKRLRHNGVIPAGTRFQVCLPTPLCVMLYFVRPEYQAQVEPMYEEVLRKSLQNMQSDIPSNDLAIQWDAPLEMALLEGVGGEPWFEFSPRALVARLERLASFLEADVQMGFHLCYGDLGHQHFAQPTDTSKLVQFANLISTRITRHIHWVHMPVPQSRTDDEYFAPLERLELHPETELYLGLVHPNDHDGTLERIKAAQRVVPEFGVATECGWGRTLLKDVSSIIDTLRAVSNSV